jgi:hypothetical protein
MNLVSLASNNVGLCFDKFYVNDTICNGEQLTEHLLIQLERVNEFMRVSIQK